MCPVILTDTHTGGVSQTKAGVRVSPKGFGPYPEAYENRLVYPIIKGQVYVDM